MRAKKICIFNLEKCGKRDEMVKLLCFLVRNVEVVKFGFLTNIGHMEFRSITMFQYIVVYCSIAFPSELTFH